MFIHPKEKESNVNHGKIPDGYHIESNQMIIILNEKRLICLTERKVQENVMYKWQILLVSSMYNVYRFHFYKDLLGKLCCNNCILK